MCFDSLNKAGIIYSTDIFPFCNINTVCQFEIAQLLLTITVALLNTYIFFLNRKYISKNMNTKTLIPRLRNELHETRKIVENRLNGNMGTIKDKELDKSSTNEIEE